MSPKGEDNNYDAEAITDTKSTEIPNNQVMADAGKIHLGTYLPCERSFLTSSTGGRCTSDDDITFFSHHLATSTIIQTDPSQAWGKGLVADVKRTVMTHWVEEMTNFN